MSQTLIILIPGFPTDENDSTCLPSPQSFVRNLNREFPELKIIIIAFHYPYRTDQYIWHGNSVYSFNGKGYPKWLRPLLWIRIIRMLNQLNRTQNILGMLSFWCLEEAMIGKYYCHWKNITHKIWMHGQDARKGNPFISWTRPLSNDLVAISEALALEVKKNYNITPRYVIHNGIEHHTEHAITNKTIHLLSVGSLTPLKQFDILLRVAKELQKSVSDLKVILVGSGPEREILKKEVERLQLNQCITLTGEIPHDKVLELMRRSKVFVHPSSYEGYSTVCLEALYAGCHVVSFVYPEKEQIDHWHITDNEESMTKLCEKLLLQNTEFTSVAVHDMKESAKKMITLFTSSQ